MTEGWEQQEDTENKGRAIIVTDTAALHCGVA